MFCVREVLGSSLMPRVSQELRTSVMLWVTQGLETGLCSVLDKVLWTISMFRVKQIFVRGFLFFVIQLLETNLMFFRNTTLSNEPCVLRKTKLEIITSNCQYNVARSCCVLVFCICV